MFFRGFRLFAKAIGSTRHEMWVSVQVLVATTLLLALLLFLVEHNAQPDVFTNYWDALLWSFMGYIDDPGEFASYGPVTFWGRVLKIACAIVNIAIFAVPAGLIAGGFSDAIADDKREKELAELKERIAKAFRRKQVKTTNIRTVPRYTSVTNIQVQQEIDTKDIIDAIRNSDNFRLCNLAAAKPESESPVDRLVVELIPGVGRTSYGCFIDRGSNVTIVAPSAATEVGLGNFAYYLALFGNFNYISKEYDVDKDEPQSFYIVNNPDATDSLKKYIEDIKSVSRGKDKWVIFLIAADSVHPESLHFITRANEKAVKNGCTIIDRHRFDEMYLDAVDTIKSTFDLSSELDERYRPVGVNNISVRIGGGEAVNAFTLRLDWAVAAFDNRHVRIALALAGIFSKALSGIEIEESAKWKKPGYDYNYEN